MKLLHLIGHTGPNSGSTIHFCIARDECVHAAPVNSDRSRTLWPWILPTNKRSFSGGAKTSDHQSKRVGDICRSSTNLHGTRRRTTCRLSRSSISTQLTSAAVACTPIVYRMFGYQNTELYRHYVRFNCSIAHSKTLGDLNGVVLVSIFR